MMSNLKIALLAFTCIASSVAATTPASADNVTVTIGPGGLAFGFSDGYWDQNRHWHRWRNDYERDRFRRAYPSYYTHRRHDHVNGWGWRDDHRWWENNHHRRDHDNDRDHHRR